MKTKNKNKVVAWRDSSDFNCAIICVKCSVPADRVVPVYGNPNGSTCEYCGKKIALGSGVSDDHAVEEFIGELNKQGASSPIAAPPVKASSAKTVADMQVEDYLRRILRI